METHGLFARWCSGGQVGVVLMIGDGIVIVGVEEINVRSIIASVLIGDIGKGGGVLGVDLLKAQNSHS